MLPPAVDGNLYKDPQIDRVQRVRDLGTLSSRPEVSVKIFPLALRELRKDCKRQGKRMPIQQDRCAQELTETAWAACSAPTQVSAVFLEGCLFLTELCPAFSFNFTDCLLIYYGFQFCFFMSFLCVQMCVCQSLFFLCAFFVSPRLSVLSYSALLIFIFDFFCFNFSLIFFFFLDSCLFANEKEKERGWLWVGGKAERLRGRGNHHQNISDGKKNLFH